MKVKVIKQFNDRFTKERREKGDLCEYSKERAEELEKEGFVTIEKIKQEQSKQNVEAADRLLFLSEKTKN